MDYQHIRTDLDENILTITLNRPDRLNAFTLRMKDELVHAFGEADQNDAVRAVIGWPRRMARASQASRTGAKPNVVNRRSQSA